MTPTHLVYAMSTGEMTDLGVQRVLNRVQRAVFPDAWMYWERRRDGGLDVFLYGIEVTLDEDPA